MSFSPLIQRFVASLFGHDEGIGAGDPAVDPTFLHQAIELVVDETQPRLRLLPDYADRLAPYVRRAVGYMRSLGADFPGAFTLSPAAWNSDPRTNAFFATPGDITQVLRDSEDLRAFFDDPANALLDEAYAMLVMEKVERRSLGVATQGEVVHHDVPRQTLSFENYHLVAPAPTLEAERHAVGLRIFRSLADIALQNILARQAEARDLGEEKALLSTRLRQARARAASVVAPLCTDPQSTCPGADELERQLAEVEERLGQLRTRQSTLEDTLAAVGEVIGDPAHHLALQHTHLWVDRLGVVRPGPDPSGQVNELFLTEGEMQTHGRTRRYVIAIARCQRTDQPPRPRLKDLPEVL